MQATVALLAPAGFRSSRRSGSLNVALAAATKFFARGRVSGHAIAADSMSRSSRVPMDWLSGRMKMPVRGGPGMMAPGAVGQLGMWAERADVNASKRTRGATVSASSRIATASKLEGLRTVNDSWSAFGILVSPTATWTAME